MPARRFLSRLQLHHPSATRRKTLWTATYVPRRILLAVSMLLALAAVEPLAARAYAASRDMTPKTSAPVYCNSHISAHDEPSHLAPPTSIPVPGYSLAYCTDFTGSSTPAGWGLFSGVPRGDPSGYFDPSHVVVHHGVLTIETYRDPAHGNVWATGGVCQCGAHRTYGAFFVRSRSIGVGPDNVELLWPVARVWPPEIDFNESSAYPSSSTWTVHYTRGNRILTHTAKINLDQWHTWGVFWTPSSLVFTVDGWIWGEVTSRLAIPTGPMTLDIQSQTFCGIAPACPAAPAAFQVDWVAEFTRH